MTVQSARRLLHMLTAVPGLQYSPCIGDQFRNRPGRNRRMHDHNKAAADADQRETPRIARKPIGAREISSIWAVRIEAAQPSNWLKRRRPKLGRQGAMT